jgi:para-nitrobenzyl esterase
MRLCGRAAAVVVVAWLAAGCGGAGAAHDAAPVDAAPADAAPPDLAPADDAGAVDDGAADDAAPADDATPDATPVCQPGATRCSGTQVETCGGDGQWGSATPCPGSTQTCADDSCCPVILTSGGPVEGQASGETCRYLGIPYAAPPVGALRWKPPQPVAPWTSPRPSQAGARCAQLAVAGYSPQSTDEDCLYVNVWTPPGAATAAPIMVQISGTVFGWGTEPIQDPTKLVTATGAVVVTVDSRLGAFGFLSNAELRAEDAAHPSSGNYGIEDQIAALQWVQANAAVFGGDPNRVTIFGESQRGTNVWVHLASPLSQGLFARAIVQSGWAYHLRGVHTLAEADEHGATFALLAGCSDPSQLLACLRSASPGQILSASSWAYMLPTVDGVVLPDAPITRFESGTFNQVPLLLGTTRDEGTVFVLPTPPTDAATFQTFAEGRFPGHGAAIVAEYPAAVFGGAHELAAAAAYGDGLVVCPARRVARAFVAAGVPTFRYSLAHAVNDSRWPSWVGAFHGSDNLFVFGNSWPTCTLQADDLLLSEQVMGYWGAMAASGDPNGGGRPAWPGYDLATETQLVLDLTPSTETAYNAAHCDFWDSISP